MTRFLMALLRYPIGERKPVTCSEAGRRGAYARSAKARAKIHAVARTMRAELGMPPAEVLSHD